MKNSMRTFWFAALAMLLAIGSLSPGQDKANRTLVISAIPDQDPKTLERLYGRVAEYLSRDLGVSAKFQAVPDYQEAVNGFKTGKIDLVWFGGLTGVQARQHVPDAHYIAQRDIDAKFRSVFVTPQQSPIKSLEDLKGHTFTFGNEWSTSGRLMPQHFLKEKGITMENFKGKPNFAATHDETVDLVAKGTYEAGVVNEQVWRRRYGGKTDVSQTLRVFHTSPEYPDYHWMLHPNAAKRLGGEEFVKKMQDAFLKMDQPHGQAETLPLFGAKKFIPTRRENYDRTEQIARDLNLLNPKQITSPK